MNYENARFKRGDFHRRLARIYLKHKHFLRNGGNRTRFAKLRAVQRENSEVGQSAMETDVTHVSMGMNSMKDLLINIKCHAIPKAILLSLFLLIHTAPVWAGDAILSWDPNTEPDLAGYKVYYGTAAGHYGTPIDAGNVITFTATGLGLGTYYFAITAYDTSGNESGYSNETSKTFLTLDTTPPVLSAITSGNVTSGGALISWGTDEPATTQVEYGLTTAYGSTTPLINATLLNSHSQTLTGLSASTLYHYRVKSADASGNLSVSDDHVFTTGTAPDTTPPADVQNFTAVEGAQQITLSWTNPPDLDFVGVHIRFRTDHFPTDINDGTLLGDFTGQPNQTMSTAHTGLQNGVTYYYSAASYDGSGNFQSAAFVSATPANAPDDLETPTTGGCGMVRPTDGNPPGPAQAADMIMLLLVILTPLIRNALLQPAYRLARSLAILTPGYTRARFKDFSSYNLFGDAKMEAFAFIRTGLAACLILSLSACNGGEILPNSPSETGFGTATLVWDPPTTNADETPLTDLAGYRVYYGTAPGAYGPAIDVVGIATTYTMSGMGLGTYYFAVKAYDIWGNESDFSNMVSKVIE